MKKFIFILFPLMVQMGFAQTFTLSSEDLGGQATSEQEFSGFGCTGDNISPQLSWENAPEGTKSFAITMYDPDAPTGSGWWHWVVFDIPADVDELPSGAGKMGSDLLPDGSIQSNTSYGAPGYGGPCPPEGDKPHAYIITIYALKVDKIGLDKNATPAIAGFYLNNQVIEKASIVAYYQR